MSAERFFDDLARTLAQPMPRRRALRITVGAVVGLAVPGVAARAALSAPKFDPPCKGTFPCECASTIPGLFAKTACPKDCPYHVYECVCPGGPMPKAVCDPQETCPEERRHCGPCCAPDQTCNTLVGKCVCKRGEKCGPRCCQGSDCCINTRLPSDDPRRWVCCKPPNRCEAGICKCPNGKPSCSSGRECCKSSQRCTDCYIGSSDLDDSLFFGQKCCSPRDRCCGKTCCNKNRSCCGPTCCPAGSQCARAGGKDICCPDGRWAVVGNQSNRTLGFVVCCPPGTVGIPGDGCCPPGEPDCCPPTDGAGNVLNCANGGRVCVSGRCVNP